MNGVERMRSFRCRRHAFEDELLQASGRLRDVDVPFGVARDMVAWPEFFACALGGFEKQFVSSHDVIPSSKMISEFADRFRST